jgi:cyanophycin synthetase
MVELDGKQILMDYCHNVHGLEALVDFTRRMNPEKTVAMVAIPGDRSDTDIAQFGELAGKSFDRIVIREDDNRRGRAVGEVAGKLHEAILAAGLDKDAVTEEHDELEAALMTIDLASKEDFVLLLVDKPAKIMEKLQSLPGFRAVVS